ncbi:putative anti-sigma regulatory factor, serine/threonine protein kinase [Alicyclobacillus hesperidum URH17-3-68]|nr:putative anti-sigma regulatory factor, serine/threonine protein kinase [Alicyclobacillus hesperidum URH17-3-68]
MVQFHITERFQVYSRYSNLKEPTSLEQLYLGQYSGHRTDGIMKLTFKQTVHNESIVQLAVICRVLLSE